MIRSFQMIRHCIATAALLWPLVTAAAVDVNKAGLAELETVTGLGPQLADKILAERKLRGAFKDWVDLIARVHGVGDRNAARFSAAGLTVDGKPDPFTPPPQLRASAAAKAASQASAPK
jgi:competence protein ComEA